MSKRRFPTGEHEYYDLAYQRLKNESQVLAGPSFVGSVHNVIFDESGLLAYKQMLTGEATSEKEQREDEEVSIEIGSAQIFNGKIPKVKRQLAAFDRKWRRMQMDDVDQGKEVRSDDEKNVEMENEQLLLFARLDIYQEELSKIEEKIAGYTEKEQDKDDHRVLAYGLIETSELFNGIVKSIDGQDVEKVNGFLIIKDERSPYNGMSVPDYRALAKSWLAERKKLDAKHLIVLQEAARKAFEPVPQSYISVTGYTRIPRAYLPKWPKGIVNHLEMVEEEEEITEETK